MIHSMAERVALFFVSHGSVDRDDLDIYTYACELILSNIINVLIGITVSVLSGKLFEGIAFIVCFVVLRRTTGGYHAKTHFICIVTFALILSSSLLLLEILKSPIIAIVLGIVSVIVIFFLAPVEHKNNPFDREIKILLKVQSRIVAIIIFIIMLAGICIFRSQIFSAVALSMFSVCGSMAYATLINKDKAVD